MQHMACYCRSPIALATLRAISSEYRPAQRALMALPLTLSPERIAPVMRSPTADGTEFSTWANTKENW